MPLADYAAPLHYNPGSPMPRPPGIPPLSVMQQSTPQYDSPISAAAGKSSKSIDSMLKGYGGRSSRNLEYSAEVNDYSTPSYPKNPVKTPKKQQSNYGYPVTYTPQKPTKTNYPQEPSYNIPEKTTHITSYDLPGKIPNKTPEITSYDFPGQTPQDIPNIIPYDFPGNIPDYKPEIYDTPKNYQDITRISTVTITTPELISIPELTPVKEKPIKTKPKKFKPPEIDPKPFDDWMIHNPVPDVEFVFGGIIDGGKQSQSKSKSGKSKKSGKAKAERKDNKKYYELF